jgi:tetratricopeptide (TPR) repeat protein
VKQHVAKGVTGIQAYKVSAMNRLRAVSFGLILIPICALAQNRPATVAPKSQQVMSKALTPADSGIVKQMFFAALREKTIENYSLAGDLFNKVLQADPANDAAMYELANIRVNQKNQTSAIELLERAVTLKPNNEYYWVQLAELYEKSNQAEKLNHVFNELTRLNPDKPEYLFNKATLLTEDKNYDEALKVYNQLEAVLGPTDDILAARQKIYLKQGKLDQATAELQETIKNNPNEIRYYLLLSELYNSNGFNDKALDILLRAEKINNANPRVHLALADIYRDKKNNDASFNELKLAFASADLSVDQKVRIVLGYVPKFPDANAKQSALMLSRIIRDTQPEDAKANSLYGDMLMQNDQLKEARAAYKKAVTINGQVYAIWEQLVRIDLSDNDITNAIKDGQEALTIFPNQAWLNYLVGVAFVQNKDYSKALGYLSNVPLLETADRSLLSLNYSAIGDCYHSLKDIKKSDEAYNKALEYNPDNVYTLNNYAYYLSLRNEQLDKAAVMSKHSNELQPNLASFQDTYAVILFKQRKYTEAKTWIDKALFNDKGKSAVEVEHLGDILYGLGQPGEAVQNWKKAKSIGGGSPVLERKINERKYVE